MPNQNPEQIALQSLRTVGIESIRIFVFSVLKKSPKEINFFFAKRALSYIFLKEEGTVEMEKRFHNLVK